MLEIKKANSSEHILKFTPDILKEIGCDYVQESFFIKESSPGRNSYSLSFTDSTKSHDFMVLIEMKWLMRTYAKTISNANR